MSNTISASSFRDPSGSIFTRNRIVYRQVNRIYKENYDRLISSGLYQNLVDAGLLVSHEETEVDCPESGKLYKVLKPEQLPLISYPYEWSFSQLKDAALTTLEIQSRALKFGMTLKDCSAYNIQFSKGRPVFIDTLSFEIYKEGELWVPYRQFCQHFLAPLALMSYRDIRLNQLLRIYIDGVPLDLASLLLPAGTYLRFSLLSHIHLHARSQKYFADKTVEKRPQKMSRLSFSALIDNLDSTVKSLAWKAQGTEWADYYNDTNYSPAGLQHKRQVVEGWVDRTKPKAVWDLGANMGEFSRVASNKGIYTVSFDIDPAAVEKNYLKSVANKESSILPLVLDLTNPSPGVGWDNSERMSWMARGPADMVFALALIHHLAISNNLPLDRIAAIFGRVCASLIIEFVPKTDSQVKRLLSTRVDIFPDYRQEAFEREFEKYFRIKDSVTVKDSERVLYLMEKK